MSAYQAFLCIPLQREEPVNVPLIQMKILEFNVIHVEMFVALSFKNYSQGLNNYFFLFCFMEQFALSHSSRQWK